MLTKWTPPDPWEVPFERLALSHVVVVSFGGGLNSTALLVRWVLSGYPPPHRIYFADTGGERPETYAHLLMFSNWLRAFGFPGIVVTRKGGRSETLEQYCLRIQMLPSMAYGRKGCSHKFKIEPQEREVNRWGAARTIWKYGSKVVKIIGYGAEEQKRISKAKLEDDKYFYRFPLDEWGMRREDCVQMIQAAGLPVPPKSSCFFCPSSTKPEILALPPELKSRAITIELVADLAGRNKSAKGLGRRFAWRDFIAGAETAEPIVNGGCMYCVDGSPEGGA